MTKTIAVLGATGSVGTQALDVARTRGYKVGYMTASTNVLAMESFAREFSPAAVAMSDEGASRELKLRLADTNIRVLSGSEGILEGISAFEGNAFVNSILGGAGLLPTLAVIDTGKRLALANKESLVMAGRIVMQRAEASGCKLIPVDSEHSAIFQSLKSGKKEEIKSIILTASGGPFFGKTKEELSAVTVADTLAHPTWQMGKKITVDSATLMNKGFELIEAVHLFGVEPEKIKVTVHRESILHSAVEYVDNTVIGEMSSPDMRMCVQYALDYPDRMPSASAPLDLFGVGRLTFMPPDEEAFPLLPLAREAVKMGGACPAVLNAADEIAVEAFLCGKLGFLGIYSVVSGTLERLAAASKASSVEDVLIFDREARLVARSLI